MTGNIYQDAFMYIAYIAPLFILLGGLSFADIVIMTIVRLVKQAKNAVKW